MQPNQQQGYYQPEQPQAAQPSAPPPVPPTTPAPQASPVAPVVDPAAMQAALNEPAPAQPAPPPQPQEEAVPSQAAEDDQYDEEYDDENIPEGEPVTWVAHEFIHREKGALWFMLFSVVIIGLLAVSILTQAWTFTVLIVVIAVLVIVYSRRPPRELTYSLTDEGLMIDDKLHKFSNFKSFGVIRDGEEYSVMLIPTQRFQPGISVYFPEEAGEDIVDMLGARLPMKELRLDAVDRIVRMLRL